MSKVLVKRNVWEGKVRIRNNTTASIAEIPHWCVDIRRGVTVGAFCSPEG